MRPTKSISMIKNFQCVFRQTSGGRGLCGPNPTWFCIGWCCYHCCVLVLCTHLGIVGLCGLGHVAVKFAKALGAKVTVISTSPTNQKEAFEQLSADAFLVSHDQDQLQVNKKVSSTFLEPWKLAFEEIKYNKNNCQYSTLFYPHLVVTSSDFTY